VCEPLQLQQCQVGYGASAFCCGMVLRGTGAALFLALAVRRSMSVFVAVKALCYMQLWGVFFCKVVIIEATKLDTSGNRFTLAK
jgi:hypothetical protein